MWQPAAHSAKNLALKGGKSAELDVCSVEKDIFEKEINMFIL